MTEGGEPRLFDACSRACVDALPEPAERHVATPHRGGPSVVQPSARRGSSRSPFRGTPLVSSPSTG
ncbi:hypothetical protein AB0E04_12545 [Streptomyces sp. NPDC048251]|uniref:hypothetical protein n=1 Tax=unclassified Streptomyces TaxID=2593676 RepID=UPI00325353E0